MKLIKKHEQTDFTFYPTKWETVYDVRLSQEEYDKLQSILLVVPPPPQEQQQS